MSMEGQPRQSEEDYLGQFPSEKEGGGNPENSEQPPEVSALDSLPSNLREEAEEAGYSDMSPEEKRSYIKDQINQGVTSTEEKDDHTEKLDTAERLEREFPEISKENIGKLSEIEDALEIDDPEERYQILRDAAQNYMDTGDLESVARILRSRVAEANREPQPESEPEQKNTDGHTLSEQSNEVIEKDDRPHVRDSVEREIRKNYGGKLSLDDKETLFEVAKAKFKETKSEDAAIEAMHTEARRMLGQKKEGGVNNSTETTTENIRPAEKSEDFELTKRGEVADKTFEEFGSTDSIEKRLYRQIDETFGNVEPETGKELAEAVFSELEKYPDLSNEQKEGIIDQISQNFPENQDTDKARYTAGSLAQQFSNENKEEVVSTDDLKEGDSALPQTPEGLNERDAAIDAIKPDLVEYSEDVVNDQPPIQKSDGSESEKDEPENAPIQEESSEDSDEKNPDNDLETTKRGEVADAVLANPERESLDENKKEKISGKKAWEDLSEEERAARLENRAELKEVARELKKSRANLAVLEKKSARLLLGSRYWDERGKALRDYNENRVEYIGGETRKMVRERQRMAAEKSKKLLPEEKVFSSVYENWKRFGNINLEQLVRGGRFEAKTEFGKKIQRFVTARGLASAGLLGVGTMTGLSAVGVAALSARRVFSGVSAGFGSYDLMKIVSERRLNKRLSTLNQETIDGMSTEQIDKEMAELEAQAMFSGKRMVVGKEYNLLKRTLEKRSREEGREVSPEYLYNIDYLIGTSEYQKRGSERVKKASAFGLGAFIGEATWLREALANTPEAGEVSAEAIQEQVQNGPVLSSEDIAEAEQSGELPKEVLDAAEKPISETGSRVFAESVKKGEGLWHAAERIVENGDISKEQFTEAWANSTIKLAGGETVPISDVGLVQEGQQIIYIPETGGVGAHFELQNYTEDTLHVGSNQELAEAFEKAGKEKPEWLKTALDNEIESSGEELGMEQEKQVALESSSETTDKIMEGQIQDQLKEDAKAQGISEEALEKSLEEERGVVEQAVEGKLDIAEAEIEKLSWGNVEFIKDERGNVVDYVFEENLSPTERSSFVEEAVTEVLRPDFDNLLSQDLSDSYRTNLGLSGSSLEGTLKARVLPDRIIHAKEAAWEVFRLQDVLGKLERNSESWLFVKSEIEKIIVPSNILGSNKVIYNGHFLNTEIFKDIKLP